MNHEEAQARINWLMDELAPISGHSDIYVSPHAYDPKSDTVYLNAAVRPPVKWADAAYKISKDNDFKYDRDFKVYGLDGQPRVSSDGLVWVRYVGDFLDGSTVGMNVWTRETSHHNAEVQLLRLYKLFRENDGLETMDVVRKFFTSD